MSRERRPTAGSVGAPLAAFLLIAAACGPELGAPLPGPGEAADTEAVAAAVREAVTTTDLERDARAIVEHERPSGSPGENAAIDYIVAELRAAGIPVEVHTFEAYASDPVFASVAVPGTDLAYEAITASFSASVPGLEAPLVDLGSLDDLPELEVGTGERLVLEGEDMGGPFRHPYPDLSGAIALLDGLPRNVPTVVLERLGAVGAIFVNPEERLNDLIVTSTWGTPSLLSYHRLPNLPVAQVSRGSGEALRTLLAQGSLRVRLTTEVVTGWKPLRIPVARIPGPDPDASYVLFGGHIDGWYHGATDEGASNAAMLELARAFWAERGSLRRGLVVAWWPGHSNARYGGSTWFADHFFDELRRRAVAYVNVDGIGQMGAKTFGAATTASFDGLARSVVSRRQGVEIRPGRPGRNSDQSFNGVGLPLLQLNHNRTDEDGGYWWWHTPDDTFDKIDFAVLETDAELYADALAALLVDAHFPADLTAQVEAVGAALQERQAEAGGAFDLSGAMARQGELAREVELLQAAVPREGRGGLERGIVSALRPLHRILYVPVTPYHPDAGAARGALPGLEPVGIMAEEPATSDRYRFAEASLVRERNRILEALDESLMTVRILRREIRGR